MGKVYRIADQTRLNELSICLPFWEIGGFGSHGFKPWSSQINDLNIDDCHCLSKRSTLLSYGKDWLDQYQDNVLVLVAWSPSPAAL